MNKFKRFREMLFTRLSGSTVMMKVGKETAYLLDIDCSGHV